MAKLTYSDVLTRLLEEGLEAPTSEMCQRILNAKNPQTELEKFIKKVRRVDVARADLSKKDEAEIAASKISSSIDPSRTLDELLAHAKSVKHEPLPEWATPFDLRLGILEERKLSTEEEEKLKEAQAKLGKSAGHNLLSAVLTAARFKPTREPILKLLAEQKLPTEKGSEEEFVKKFENLQKDEALTLSQGIALELRKALDKEQKPEYKKALGHAILSHAWLRNTDLANKALGSGAEARSAFNELIGDRAMDVHRDLQEHNERVAALSEHHQKELRLEVKLTDSLAAHREQLAGIQKTLQERKSEIAEKLKKNPSDQEAKTQDSELSEALHKIAIATGRMTLKPDLPPLVGIGEKKAGVQAGRIPVRLEPSRDPLNLVMGHVSGDCVANCDVDARLKALNDDRFINWRIIDKSEGGHSWIGNVYTVWDKLKDGTPAMIIDAIQPEAGYKFSPKQLSEGILNGFKQIADKTGHLILASTNSSHWSNRDTMQHALREHFQNKPQTTKADFQNLDYMQSVRQRQHYIYYDPRKPHREKP